LPEAWSKPTRFHQKDRNARWTVKFSKAKPKEDGEPQIDIAIPVFGYESHVSIQRRHGFIRRGRTSDGAAHDGARLREGLRSGQHRLRCLGRHRLSFSSQRGLSGEAGKVSRIHHKKPSGRPMPQVVADHKDDAGTR
jgi:transposase, IS5 family